MAMAQSPGNGIMSFVSPQKLAQAEQQTYRQDAEAKQQRAEIINLAAHIRTAWVRNKQAKQPVEEQMLKNLLQLNGKYDSDALAKIQAMGGTDIFLNISSVVASALEYWLADILLPAGERPYSLAPTPIPDLSDDIEQELQSQIGQQYMAQIQQGMAIGTINPEQVPDMLAQIKADIQQAVVERAEKDTAEFETEIDDELREGGWYEAIRKIIPDISTYPTAIVHGPEVKRVKRQVWNTDLNGLPVCSVEKKPTRTYRRVSGFDLYPSPNATSFDDGDLIERIQFRRTDLVSYIGTPGFDDDAIRSVLELYGRGGLREWLANDFQRYEAEGRPTSSIQDNKDEIDGLKYMGRVQGVMLLQWGMKPESVPDPLADYEVTAYLIGTYVIKAKLNDDPLDKRNYWSTSFKKSNDSPWGKAPLELMASNQRICNGCARAIVNNMGHASGPSWWAYGDMFDGLPPTRIIPWQRFLLTSKPGVTQAPMGFFQPQIIVEQLLKIFQYYFEMSSEVTGIPKYIYGSGEGASGAGDTASGMAMMMNNASKGIKRVASNVDQDVITLSVKAHWLHIMLYEPERAKGDINVVARASEYLLQQEQLQVRRNEFLGATNNPNDMAIIGLEGRSEVLREAAKGLKMPVDKIVPSRQKMMELKKKNEMMGVFQTIGDALGLPVDQVAAIASGEVQAGQPGEQKQIGLDPAGNPAGGQDARTMD